ncbi:hypothetical protein D3C81_990160 [compost metagenome]
MKKFYKFIVVFFVFGLIGCYSEKFIDISNEEGYSKLIGKTYEITGPIIGHGIRKHSNAPVDYVTLMPPPGIGGHQIAFANLVPIGSKIKIVKVLKSNRLIDSDITLIIEVYEGDFTSNVPIRIDLTRGNEGSKSTLLNEKFYRKIDN